MDDSIAIEQLTTRAICTQLVFGLFWGQEGSTPGGGVKTEQFSMRVICTQLILGLFWS